jgi:hypothetical protein
MTMKNLTILFAVMITLTRCNIGAGTLGSFDENRFPIKKSDFLTAFDSLTEKQIPVKWKENASSIEHTYEFLADDVTCLYMNDNPEEMYFVSYQGNSKFTVISVRSVFRHGRWSVKRDLDDEEIDRIEKRFEDEIIKKIENRTRTKAERID